MTTFTKEPEQYVPEQERSKLLPYLERIYEQYPQLRYPETPDYQRWPIYTLTQTDDLIEIWQRMAEALNVRFLRRCEELKSVNAALNTSSHNALASGILWVKKEREYTPQVRTIGVTYHPLLANQHVYLTTPKEWRELYIRMLPLPNLEFDDAARQVTFTADIDKADYTRLNPQQAKAVLLIERGIGSGQPQYTAIQAEAQAYFDVSYMQANHFIPFKVDKASGVLSVYMTNVEDADLIGRLAGMTRMTIKPFFMEAEDEEIYWELKDLARLAEEAQVRQSRAELLGDLLD